MQKRKSSIVVGIALIAILFSTFLQAAPASARAEDESARLTQTRLNDIHVEFRIEFSSPMTGDFGGIIGGKHFNCQQASDTVLICTGAYRVGSDPATLIIYSKPSGEVVFQQVIYPPKSLKEKEEKPEKQEEDEVVVPPPPPPPPACEPRADFSGC